MKICKIYIKGFQQFQDIELDFTHPETGEPVEKVCFIGRNGTGKTKLLEIINCFLISLGPDKVNYNIVFGESANSTSRVLIKIYISGEYFYYYFSKVSSGILFSLKKNSESKLFDLFNNKSDAEMIFDLINIDNDIRRKDLDLKDIFFEINSGDLVTYSPAESPQNLYSQISDVPKATLNEALSLFSDFHYYHKVSSETISDFWRLLIYLIKKRDDEREKYETTSENINKTKRQLIEEFDAISPKILNNLAIIWNKILFRAGLEFDVQGANKPIQLNDNLKAYVRLIETKGRIKYNELSTGIRNFIFRLGHIYSLYFDRDINRGFLLIDEPENSLYPDFLLDLVETYQKVIVDKSGQNNTQMFFATHNPIIAAQFQPYERIILDWNDDGTVFAKKGYAPVGDDPNDVLSSDFELKDLMGPEGRKMWEQYEGLKKQLIRAKEKSEKDKLIKEINRIGTLYNFS